MTLSHTQQPCPISCTVTRMEALWRQLASFPWLMKVPSCNFKCERRISDIVNIDVHIKIGELYSYRIGLPWSPSHRWVGLWRWGTSLWESRRTRNTEHRMQCEVTSLGECSLCSPSCSPGGRTSCWRRCGPRWSCVCRSSMSPPSPSSLSSVQSSLSLELWTKFRDPKISPHLLLVTLGAARGLVSDEEDLTELHRAELTPGKGHIHYSSVYNLPQCQCEPGLTMFNNIVQ